MEAQSHPAEPANEELNLYPEWRSPEAAARSWLARSVSVGLHLAVAMLLGFTSLGRTRVHDMSRIVAQFREPARLVMPPRELTQTAPNRGKVSKEVNLESLLPRPRVFVPPSLPPGALPSGRPAALPAPPPIDVAQEGSTPLQFAQIQPVEKPKPVFETPGAARAEESGTPRLALPGSSVADLGRSLARGRGVPQVVVNDLPAGLGGVGPGLDVSPKPGTVGSSLELLSDPRGVDFKPYLVQVLAAVKRNWLAVLPESVALGRRGRVVVQFIINRDGSVPKLVIATPSGADALDRAAVAGISATNPFPPLPSEFRGEQVRLQFVFLYNMRPF
jgi:TonB family protein